MNVRKLLAVISENWPAKVLSIALALIIFMFHKISILEHRFFSAPLHIEIDSHIAPASIHQRTVRINVRGEASFVRSLAEDDIEAFVDLRGRGRGTHRVRVQVRKRDNAFTAETLEIRVDPQEITLTLDSKISRFVSVKPTTRGSVRAGHELVSFSLNPSQVLVDGPADLVSAILDFSTEAADLEGRSGDFSVMLPIVNDNPLINIRGTTMTEFTASVRQIMGIANFNALPIRSVGLDQRFAADIDVRLGAVRLGGNQQELERYTPVDNLLVIDFSSITQPGIYTLPVSVNLSPGFSLLYQYPERVRVNVRSSNF